MKRLTPKTFIEETSNDTLTVVVFGSLDCAPCVSIKAKIESLESKFSKINFCEYQCAQLGSHEIIKANRISLIPRVVAYRGGIELGRFAFDKSIAAIKRIFKRLETCDKILTEASDPEEVTRFYTKVFKVLNWNFQDFPEKEWETKGGELMDLAHSIIDSDPEWGHLTNEQIQLKLRDVNVKQI